MSKTGVGLGNWARLLPVDCSISPFLVRDGSFAMRHNPDRYEARGRTVLTRLTRSTVISTVFNAK